MCVCMCRSDLGKCLLLLDASEQIMDIQVPQGLFQISHNALLDDMKTFCFTTHDFFFNLF